MHGTTTSMQARGTCLTRVFLIPSGPPTAYLSLSLRNLGSVAGMITMFGITLISETVIIINESLPFLVALYLLPDKPNQWVFFGLASGLLSYPYTHPIQVGWCSRNSGAVASRTVNASLYNMCVPHLSPWLDADRELQLLGSSKPQSGCTPQIYRKDDAPMYRRGNRVLIIISCINLIVVYPGTKAYYIWRNKQRAEE
ncbi:hypothetical protein B0H14DRAFT_2694361 [Mycena olivaceomarginata]|nr:hypothetical protein B0H14DRAFT_2694361 [Mycena olivaceomarginata]